MTTQPKSFAPIFEQGEVNNRILYYRCSGKSQDFEGQDVCISTYMTNNHIDSSKFSVATEFASGNGSKVKFQDRLLSKVLNEAESGTVLYCSELSRITRTQKDMYCIAELCKEKDITIIQCKDGMQIENRTIAGKALIFALSFVAEIELDNINTRTGNGKQRCFNELKEQGYYIAKRSGKIRTGWGNPKGTDTTVATNASILAKQQRKELYLQSPAMNWVRDMVIKGMTREWILEDFNRQADGGMQGFTSIQGKRLTLPVLNGYIRDMGLTCK